MALVGTSITYELSESTVVDGVMPCSFWAKIIDTSSTRRPLRIWFLS